MGSWMFPSYDNPPELNIINQTSTQQQTIPVMMILWREPSRSLRILLYHGLSGQRQLDNVVHSLGLSQFHFSKQDAVKRSRNQGAKKPAHWIRKNMAFTVKSQICQANCPEHQHGKSINQTFPSHIGSAKLEVFHLRRAALKLGWHLSRFPQHLDWKT